MRFVQFLFFKHALGSGTIAWAEGETADAAAKIKVACVGDSLTEGYTSTGANSGKKGPNAYPARLQSLLGSGYEVKNLWGKQVRF